MKRNFKYLFLLLLLVAAVLVWREIFALSPDKLKFYLLDVGQGDAIFIETPSGNQVLIDGGPDKSVLKELGEVMPFWDRSLDIVVLTHPNLDHVAGLVEVLKNYEVKYLMDTDDGYQLAEYEELKKIAKEKNITRIPARRGGKMILDHGAQFLILHPDKLVSGDSNHNSIIAKLSFGEIDFLLTGDAEKGEELKLVQAGDDLESEVLKVGHHGSRTSSNPLFLEKVRPEYALISSGRKNKYGHPHREVLENLEKVGAKILRTDLDGWILLSTDGLQVF